MDKNSSSEFDVPMFARGEETELRFWCPRTFVDVLDAVVMARGGQSANVHRGTVMNEVLNEWAEKKRHEASLIQRVAICNPTGSERSVQELRVVDGMKTASN